VRSFEPVVEIVEVLTLKDDDAVTRPRKIMGHHHHDRRFSPDKMAKLDSPMRVQMQPPAALCDALELQPDSVVADLGVGVGFFALPIAEQLNRSTGAGKVIGLDVELRMLDETRRRGVEAGLESRVELEQVSGEGDIPLPDDSVDRIISVNTVHELDDRPRVFSEFARTLRPGGFVLLVDWRKRGPFDKGPPEEHRIASADLGRELEDAGFEVSFADLYPLFYGVRAALPA
jgi:ubiquinone/menaquinone biosynthesis C-methylase UbiE